MASRWVLPQVFSLAKFQLLVVSCFVVVCIEASLSVCIGVAAVSVVANEKETLQHSNGTPTDDLEFVDVLNP